MTTVEEKSRLIIEHEHRFAELLAAKVLNQPKLSLWMILVPVLFVFHLNDWQAYKSSRKAFADNLLITPRRALGEAVAALQTGRDPDIAGLTALPNLPADASRRLADLFAVLVEHYVDLLQADGGGFDSLLRSAYKNLTNYLLFLNRLSNVEKAFNKTLQPSLAAATKGATDIIKTIERQSEAIRRKTAEKIFA